MHSKKFRIIIQEGHLSRGAIINGFNAILDSDYSDKNRGNIYVALFQLSIGIERLLKIVVVLEYMIHQNIGTLKRQDIKESYGHGILKLYEQMEKIALTYNEQFEPISRDNIGYQALIEFDRFAKTSRYYNLDHLSNSNIGEDPLKTWYNNIFKRIENNEVAYKIREQKANEILRALDKSFGNPFTSIFDVNDNLMSLFDYIYLNEIHKMVNPRIIWHVIEVLEPIYHLLSDISFKAHDDDGISDTSRDAVPYMFEFFPFLLLDKPSVIKRKIWKAV